MKTYIGFHALMASLLYKSDAFNPGPSSNLPNYSVSVNATMALTETSKLNQLDPRLLSLSIEQGFFIDFSGTIQSPNLFSQKLISNLQAINGYAPAIRVGGNSQDETTYDASVDVIAIEKYASGQARPEPTKVKIGPGFYQAFKNFNTSYTLCLNFGFNNYTESLNELKAGYAAIKDHGLEHVELGNEADRYKNRKPWNTQVYAKDHSSFTQRLVKDTPFGNILQLGAVLQPPTEPWSATHIIKNGIDTSHANAWSSHFYAQSACSKRDLAHNSYSNLTSHSIIKARLDRYKTDIASANSKNLAFYIGEGNSAVCHGADGMSNAMISAIWALDHVFYGATIGIKRFYMHNGRDFFYNVFQPNGTVQGLRPLYYAYVLAAKAIGPKTFISPISAEHSTDNLVVYGLYEESKLEKLIVINSEVYNTTTSGIRTASTIQFDGHSGTLHRLTGPGADARTGITFAGQSYSDKTGEVIGTPVVENWSNSFILKATEAALVYISK